jgi:hypothetical protein
MTATARIAPFVLFVLLSTACGAMYSARISVTRSTTEASFTQEERDAAKATVVEIARAARFAETDPAGAAEPYHEFVSLSGKGSDQDTVTVSGMMRADRREILISVGDWRNGDPLPATEKLVADLRATLEQEFPDAQLTVTTKQKPRILGP